MEVARANLGFFKFTETILDFVYKIIGKYEHVRNWFYSKPK
jgi:hypothetical protein